MIDASRAAIINGDTHVEDNGPEVEFLDDIFVILTEKLYQNQPEKRGSKIIIYKLSNTAEPFLKSKEDVIKFQTSFVIVEPNLTKTIFSVKGFEYDYVFEHDSVNKDYDFRE